MNAFVLSTIIQARFLNIIILLFNTYGIIKFKFINICIFIILYYYNIFNKLKMIRDSLKKKINKKYNKYIKYIRVEGFKYLYV